MHHACTSAERRPYAVSSGLSFGGDWLTSSWRFRQNPEAEVPLGRPHIAACAHRWRAARVLITVGRQLLAPSPSIGALVGKGYGYLPSRRWAGCGGAHRHESCGQIRP